MKFLVNLLVVGGAGAIGYLAEPSLRLELTGLSPTAPAPKPQPGNSEEQLLSRIDVRAYPVDQLPKEVTLKKDVTVTDSSSGLKMTVSAGNKVKLLRLGEGTLIVGTGTPNVEGEAELQDTDVREQLVGVIPTAPAPVQQTQPMQGDAPADNGAMAGNPQGGGAMTGNEPAPDMTEKPADDAGGTMGGGTPKDGPNPALAPEKPADTAAPGEFAAMSPEDIVKTMQDSVKASEVSKIKFDQVTEWAGAEPEELEGKKYNTGLIGYKTKTILGIKSYQGKAYILGGKVVRWVNPKTGTDIQ